MSLWDIISRTGQDLLKSAVDRLQFRLPLDPVPEAWHDILARNVPLARGLSAADLFCWGIFRKHEYNDTEWFEVFSDKVKLDEIHP